jgi:hypothetical protein
MAKTDVESEDDGLLEEADDALSEMDDDEPEVAELEIDDEVEIDATDIDVTDIEVADDEDDDLEEGAALDELEAEELEMLTDDEAAETIVVDEAAEMRALRREELALDVDPEEAHADEFVCQSCFLVKRTSQLADKRKRICADCAS